MPLTLTLSTGVLPEGSERQAFAQLCDAMLKWHGLSGNTVMTPNVVGAIHLIPKNFTFSGLKEIPVALVEWKTPSFAFNTQEIRDGYFAEATNILHQLSGGKLPREHIWINVVHAVDGAWGIGGQALSNAELGAALAAG
jgi:hypothetical protein